MAALNFRVIPHLSAGGLRIPFLGTNITVANATFADLPYQALENHVQKSLVCGLVGPTSARPTNAANRDHYIDTTLAKVIFSDGVGNWYDPFTGGVV